METNVNYTIVGFFVILVTAAIILTIIWLSAGLSFETYKVYKVYMRESVSGLGEDAAVEYNGVNVGTVKHIQLNHKNPQLVEILLNIRTTTPITRGTFATLATRGLTGVTYIALQDKSTDLRPLTVEEGHAYPIIQTGPSIFVRLDIALTQITRNFHDIALSIQALLDKENLRAIKVTLANLKVFSQTLAENRGNFNTIIGNTAKASQQFEPLLKSGTHMMRTLEGQTLPSVDVLLSNLDEASHTLSEITAEIKQNPSVLIRGSERQDLGPGETR